jgi:hypothetical protein
MLKHRVAAAVAFLLFWAAPAFAADQPSSNAPQPAAASTNPTINLVNLLVKHGILTKAEAAELIRQANNEAVAARKAQAAAPPAATASAGAAATAPAPADGTVRVTYVPEIVKQQLRNEIKQEVMAQAKQENWAAPNSVPTWVQRIRLNGDVRMRYEGDFFPEGNDATGAFPNFNAINTGNPFDTSTANPNFAPQLNVNEDRNRFRLRARIGADADLGQGFSAGLRIATGENDSPVTENQSLGVANNGQGGDFSKYAVWLDRAYIKYEPVKDTNKELAVNLGRFENPFFSTNLVWYDDLNFDGAAVSGRYNITKNVANFFTAGAFPVFNTDFNFASNQPSKFSSTDKWLYAGQLGADWKLSHDYGLKVGAAYYYFQNIEGKLSDPCVVNSAADSCDTDDSRPSFAQNGNTYMALRNIIANAANNNGTINQFQYFGLATPFHEVALTGELDFDHFDPVHVVFDGEYVQNLAFDRSAISQIAVNNRGPLQAGQTVGTFQGGDSGYYLSMTVGTPVLREQWDWNVNLGYKYLESDAVVDGFTDSDFGLGGTNLKGYLIGGKLALTRNVWSQLRWMSSDSIAGPTFRVDIVQLDLRARF